MKQPKYVVYDGALCEVTGQIDVEEFKEVCRADFESRIMAAAAQLALPRHPVSWKSPMLEAYKETIKFAGLDFNEIAMETMYLFPWRVFFRMLQIIVHAEATAIRGRTINILEIPFVPYFALQGFFMIIIAKLDYPIVREYLKKNILTWRDISVKGN